MVPAPNPSSSSGAARNAVRTSHGISQPRSRGSQIALAVLAAAFTAPVDGWFLSDALYLRYRKAVADRIQELQGKGH